MRFAGTIYAWAVPFHLDFKAISFVQRDRDLTLGVCWAHKYLLLTHEYLDGQVWDREALPIVDGQIKLTLVLRFGISLLWRCGLCQWDIGSRGGSLCLILLY